MYTGVLLLVYEGVQGWDRSRGVLSWCGGLECGVHSILRRSRGESEVDILGVFCIPLSPCEEVGRRPGGKDSGRVGVRSCGLWGSEAFNGE